MNETVKQQIFDEIRAAKKILITRHFRPDGDAVGSTLGLARILRLTWPEKDIRVVNEDWAQYLAFMNDEKEPAPDDWYRDALCIAIDTGTKDRLSNKKTDLCPRLLKIDHHVDEKPYGDVSWVEDWRSSACEMIADFWMTFRDQLCMDKAAAACLYTGMVTDSGRFRFNSVTGETLRLAGALLDFGIDTETLFANLNLEDFESFELRSYIYKRLRRTENGVLYFFLTEKIRQKFGITLEDASNTISLMEGVRGCLMWILFIETPEHIRVRLRSRFVTIREVAANYHGGGHDCAAGATVYSRAEMKRLVADADARLGEYKASHEGWM